MVTNPTLLTTIVSLLVASMLKFPAAFVAVALDVPFTETVAPETGLLSLSDTVPFTVCAYMPTVKRKKEKNSKQKRELAGENASNIFFFIIASCLVDKET
jgi:hypothetical protein